jgi:malate permease and related proteins
LLSILAAIFVRVILPVAIIVSVGFVAGRACKLEQRSLSRLSLYVLVPCMVFAGMARTSISAAEVGQIFAFVLLSTAVLWPISILVARLLGLRGASANAFHLGTLLTNGVNVGFPVLTLAYGQPALERGLVYAIGMQALFQTLGVYLAAGGKLTPKQAMRQVLRMPGIYAMFAGLLVNWTGLQLPDFLYDPLKMVGDSIVPLMLVLLGMQLTELRFRGHIGPALAAGFIRLTVSAVLAVAVAAVMGLSGVTRQSMIVEASVPTAVFALVLAQEFDCEPQLVTAIIFVTTVASMFSLTVLLAAI